jgi:hypothetical protein
MKYSLRSLMTFSIRDLALVTVIVALALGWWLDHRIFAKSENKARLAEEKERTFRKLLQHTLEKGEGYTFTEDEKGNVSIQAPLPEFFAPAPNPPKK